MAFVSLLFILFMAVVTLIYFIVPKKAQWCVLLVASYVYYWINSELLILVLLGTSLYIYIIARWIFSINISGKEYIHTHTELNSNEKKDIKNSVKRKTRRVLLLGVVVVLAVLIFLKYYNFFANNANSLLSAFDVSIPNLDLLLPLGISFYTLQGIAYMVDVYRNKIEPDMNFAKFMLFMSYFPQIVQGPIARHGQLAHQLYESHSFDYERFTKGIQLIMWGFGKKILIADRIATPVNTIFDNYNSYSGIMIFLGAVMYSIQIYTDFSGGMDIARGISQVFGIDIELNFNQPYMSNSVEDFWRRWHITLGSWMRDYIFYPLSLSKVFTKMGKKSRKLFGQNFGKKLPSFLSMFIVFILVGLWHGSSWKYIAYGMYNGIFIVAGIMLSDVFYSKIRNIIGIKETSFSWRAFQIIRTFIIIAIGRLFSRAASLSIALSMFGSMFSRLYDLSALVDGTFTELGLNTANWVLLGFLIIILFLVDFIHEKGVRIRDGISRQNIIFRWIVYLGAFAVLLIFGIYGPTYESAAFIYEQF